MAVDPDFGSLGRAGPNYSPHLRLAFNVAALTIALLPIPVALLGILPVYAGHGRFLVFYAPFVCLLMLAYVVYVRDSLARTMFAHLLDPPPPPSEYGRDPLPIRLRRLISRTRRLALAVLPGILVLSSLACISGYSGLLASSLQTVAQSEADRVDAPEEVGSLSLPRTALGADGEFALWGRLPAGDSVALPRRSLEVTPTSEIPYFVELTLLYIGAFAAPLLAVLLMAIREYAKEALELSERDLVLGRLLAEPE
jgi:hypothetical protein